MNPWVVGVNPLVVGLDPWCEGACRSGGTESKGGRGEFERIGSRSAGGGSDLLGSRAQSIGGFCESLNVGCDSTR